MAYSRWSNSNWYTFHNVNDKLSLWYDMDHIYDWEYDDLKDLMKLDQSKIQEKLIEIYNCSVEDATEAIGYINNFILDCEEDNES